VFGLPPVGANCLSTLPNLVFMIDDISEPWTFHERFDLIFWRMLNASVKEKPFMAQAYK
jgi:hypothetical protein